MPGTAYVTMLSHHNKSLEIGIPTFILQVRKLKPRNVDQLPRVIQQERGKLGTV